MKTIRLAAGLAVLIVLSHLASAAPEGGRKLALVVGVNTYEGSTLSDLEFAENDAVELARVLRSPACKFDKVTLLTSKTKEKPTAANVRAALKELLKGATKADTILVAMAGHGVQVEVEDRKGEGEPKRYSFFCTCDADLTTVVYKTGHSDTMINLDHLFETLGDSNPGVKLVLVDACRNQLKAKGRTRSLAEAKVTVPDGVQALLSCGRKQVAYESEDHKHGLFFYHVLEGLRGRARNDEGVVTWASLAGYATREVPRGAKKLFGKVQTPATAGYYEGESPVLATIKAIVERPVVPPSSEKKTPPKKDDGKYVTNSIGMKLVRIPAGKFTMGSPKSDEDRDDDEDQREVTVKAFYLGIHEVTQKQFRTVMGYNPSYFSRDGKGKAEGEYFIDPAGGKDKVPAGDDPDDYPVENVNWDEAKEFCEKLSGLVKEKAAGRKYHLPSEEEWEYACRGGASSYKKYNTGDTLTTDDANFDDALKRTCKVGSYRANAFGLYDMHGNVCEWTSSLYKGGPDRVNRGGNWRYIPRGCRSADRYGFAPTYRHYNLGFRAALVPASE